MVKDKILDVLGSSDLSIIFVCPCRATHQVQATCDAALTPIFFPSLPPYSFMCLCVPHAGVSPLISIEFDCVVNKNNNKSQQNVGRTTCCPACSLNFWASFSSTARPNRFVLGLNLQKTCLQILIQQKGPVPLPLDYRFPCVRSYFETNGLLFAFYYCLFCHLSVCG